MESRVARDVHTHQHLRVHSGVAIDFMAAYSVCGVSFSDLVKEILPVLALVLCLHARWADDEVLDLFKDLDGFEAIANTSRPDALRECIAVLAHPLKPLPAEVLRAVLVFAMAAMAKAYLRNIDTDPLNFAEDLEQDCRHFMARYGNHYRLRIGNFSMSLFSQVAERFLILLCVADLDAESFFVDSEKDDRGKRMLRFVAPFFLRSLLARGGSSYANQREDVDVGNGDLLALFGCTTLGDLDCVQYQEYFERFEVISPAPYEREVAG
jgi:hypothetical protein